MGTLPQELEQDVDPQTRPPDDLPPAEERRRERHFWIRASVIAALGIAIVGLLGSALLSVSHAPKPHHVPLGYVGTESTRAALAGEAGDALDITSYPNRDAAVTAIRQLDVYGALIVSDNGIELLKSSAASPQVAQTLTTLVTAASGKADPTVTEISPLPPGDSGGGSLAVIMQVIVLAGTIGAMGLGRLVPRYRSNWARGELPEVFLVVFALLVGVCAAALSQAFGVGDHLHFWKLALSIALINLAVTASISALVSLIGSAGAALGGVLYFMLGSPISGASVALPMMPTFWHDFGQALPPGAGATLLRRVFYFPEASLNEPLLTLGLYAGIGMIVLGIANGVAGAKRRNSLANLP